MEGLNNFGLPHELIFNKNNQPVVINQKNGFAVSDIGLGITLKEELMPGRHVLFGITKEDSVLVSLHFNLERHWLPFAIKLITRDQGLVDVPLEIKANK